MTTSMDNDDALSPKAGQRSKTAARFGLAAVVAVAATAFFFGFHDNLNLPVLKEHYVALENFVAEQFAVAVGLYILVYIAVTALSLPGATALSVLGGFLFGVRVAFFAVMIGATAGATILFLIARTAFGDSLRRRARGFVSRMQEGFNKNAFSYLLLLRLIPLFPFVIVNIVPALVGMKTRSYVLATLIGIIPGVFAFVSAGNGLGAVIETGGEVKLSGLFTQPEILTPIIALSLLALIPIAYRVLRGGRRTQGS